MKRNNNIYEKKYVRLSEAEIDRVHQNTSIGKPRILSSIQSRNYIMRHIVTRFKKRDILLFHPDTLKL